MKHKIFSVLNITHPTWTRELPVKFVREVPISNEFEGGIVLEMADFPKYQVLILQRFETSDKAKFQIVVQRMFRQEELGEGFLLVLKKVDISELELFNQLAHIHEKFIPSCEGQNQPTLQA